jgi:hypothetical protein
MSYNYVMYTSGVWEIFKYFYAHDLQRQRDISPAPGYEFEKFVNNKPRRHIANN